MYLLTSHRLSTSYYTGIAINPFQGLIQGNGTASLGFLLMTVLRIRSIYNTKLVPPSILPISQVIYHLTGQIFMDDLDFNIMNTGAEDKLTIVKRAQ